jgi:hypothetical protein
VEGPERVFFSSPRINIVNNNLLDMTSRSSQGKGQPDEDDIEYDELVVSRSQLPWPLSVLQRDIEDVRSEPGLHGVLFYFTGVIVFLGSYIVASMMDPIALKAWNVFVPVIGSSFGEFETLQGPGALIPANEGLYTSILYQGQIELLPGLFGLIGVLMFVIGGLLYAFNILKSYK